MRVQDRTMAQLRDIPLRHVPLRPSTFQLLRQRGLMTTREVYQAAAAPSRDHGASTSSSLAVSMTNLADELGVSVAVASAVWREVWELCQQGGENEEPTKRHKSATTGKKSIGRGRTASELLRQQESSGNAAPVHIVTFCRGLDMLLAGGLALGHVTEVAGAPGTGKTQLAMQLAVNARLPTAFGGVYGSCLYIDTEGSFSPERAWNMAVSLVDHIVAGRKRQWQRQQSMAAPAIIPPVPLDFTPERILQGIHVYRVLDLTCLTALVEALPEILEQHANTGSNRPPIKLIVIDSIAFHFRASMYIPPSTDPQQNRQAFFDAAAQRTQILTRMAATLSQVASDCNVAVAAINQMTTKVSENDSAKLVPALGEPWAHAVTTRLLLSTPVPSPNASSSIRGSCELTKSPSLPPGAADYVITGSGFRGVPAPASA
jgi:RAD51-like protein 2